MPAFHDMGNSSHGDFVRRRPHQAGSQEIDFTGCGSNQAGNSPQHRRLACPIRSNKSHNLAFIDAWHSRVPERLYTWFGPHAPYSNYPETYRKIAQYAEKYDLGFHTHLAETEDEVNQIREKYGKSSVELLLDAGALNPRLSVAHGIYLSPSDIRLLADHGVGVVHNPSRNMKLASGIAPIPDLISAGVNVGLGTDSNLSNNNLDMFEEMRLAAFLHKLTQKNPSVLPCEQALRMATLGSASCLGMQKIIGSLEVGKRADIIIIDI